MLQIHSIILLLRPVYHQQKQDAQASNPMQLVVERKLPEVTNILFSPGAYYL